MIHNLLQIKVVQLFMILFMIGGLKKSIEYPKSISNGGSLLDKDHYMLRTPYWRKKKKVHIK